MAVERSVTDIASTALFSLLSFIVLKNFEVTFKSHYLLFIIDKPSTKIAFSIRFLCLKYYHSFLFLIFVAMIPSKTWQNHVDRLTNSFSISFKYE